MAPNCLCLICVLFVFAAIFIAVFFIAVMASVKQTSVHQILQDVVISNVSLSENNTRLDSSMLFKIWSRNANKKMGVLIWHLRIAAFYNGHTLGMAYVLPEFTQNPRNISHLQAPLHLSNLPISSDTASGLISDIEAGSLRLRIKVKVRAEYKRVDGSWQTKLGKGDLRGDDKCKLNIRISRNAVTDLISSNSSSTLQGRGCGWTLRRHIPDPDPDRD